VTDADRELLAQAEAAAVRAYAPYSRFHVGAAVRTRAGQVIEGVNVENASYPLGMCAERTALANAVVEGNGPGDLEALAVTASPCGACRQWLVEFDLERVIYRSGDQVRVVAPAELLPDTFEFSGE
jgi:cytidine deaminase